MRRRFSVFLFFLLAGVPLCSQQPLQLNYSTRQGLPSAEVYDVLQDSRGYLWFSTDAGVSRYDGYHFHNYTTADNLPDNTVFGAREDRHGRIWFYTFSGKLAYWMNDSIYQPSVNKAIEKVNGSAFSTSLLIDAGDTIWCGLHGGSGYYKILPGYTEKDLRVMYAPGYYIVKPQGESGVISGLGIVNTRPWLQKFVTYLHDGKCDSLIMPSIMAGTIRTFRKDGVMYCGEMNSLIAWRSDTTEAYGLHNVLQVCTDPEGYIWTGMRSEGVRRMRPDGKIRPDDDVFLDGRSVTDVVQDREGGFWLTTLENGVYYFPSLESRIYNSATGFPGQHIFGIRPAADGVWAWSYENHWEKAGDRVTSFRGVSSNDIHWVSQWGDSQLIVGNGWQFLYSLTDGHFQKVTYNRICNLSLYGAVHTEKGGGWVVNRNELFWLSDSNASATFMDSLPVHCTSACSGPGDTLWLAGLNGLWSYYKGTFFYYGNQEPLLRLRVDDIALDADGSLWLASRGGGLLHYRNGAVTQYGLAAGLPSLICRSVCLSHDTVWCGTNEGLCFLETSVPRKSVQLFTDRSCGLLRGVYSVCCVNGRLWILTSDGLVSYTVPQQGTPPVKPLVYLVSSAAGGTSILPGAQLEYGQPVELEFVGIHYVSVGRLKYRYRLKGLSNEWQTGENTKLNFSSLAPGDYLFEVVAIGINGLESPVPARIFFSVRPPFWQTWWFRVSMALLIAGVLFGIFRVRLRRLRSRVQLENQLTLMELSALRAQMNPHFIFNAINSIQQFILENDRRSAQKYLSKFAQLIRRVLENSRRDTISLQEEIDSLTLYLDLELLRFSSRFEYTITCDDHLLPETMRLPSMLVQPFAENAILHGLVQLEGRPGKLQIHFSTEGGNLRITIDDNGIGREASRKNNERKRHLHEPVALSVTQKRIAMLNLNTRNKVTVIITDKHNEEGHAAGTRVEILIPFRNT